jgi:hypothetical protein
VCIDPICARLISGEIPTNEQISVALQQVFLRKTELGLRIKKPQYFQINWISLKTFVYAEQLHDIKKNPFLCDQEEGFFLRRSD